MGGMHTAKAFASQHLEQAGGSEARVVAMLTKMVLNLAQEPGTGSGSGSVVNDIL